MFLPDWMIREYCEEGRIKIDPLPLWDEALGPVTLDLRLGNEFRAIVNVRERHAAEIRDRFTRREIGDSEAINLFLRNRKDLVDLTVREEPRDYSEPFYLNDQERMTLSPGNSVVGVTKERVTLPTSIGALLNGRSSIARHGLIIHATANMVCPTWDGHIVLEIMNLSPNTIAFMPNMRVCSLAFFLMAENSQLDYTKIGKYAGQTGAYASKIGLEADGLKTINPQES
jgi:dCTP deaminase